MSSDFLVVSPFYQFSAERGCLHPAEGCGGEHLDSGYRAAERADSPASGSARAQQQLTGLRKSGKQRLPRAATQRRFIIREQRHRFRGPSPASQTGQHTHAHEQ